MTTENSRRSCSNACRVVIRLYSLFSRGTSKISSSVNGLALIIGVGTLTMGPPIVLAGHHPRHTGTPAALWIFLGIIAFIGIIMWLARKRK